LEVLTEKRPRSLKEIHTYIFAVYQNHWRRNWLYDMTY